MAVAFDIPSPKTCPSISELSRVPINIAEGDDVSGWVAYSIHNYNTENNWMFGILIRDAKNKNDAISKANAAISRLVLFSGPTKEENEDEWGCLYNGEYLAAAVTPVPSIDFFKSKPYIFSH